MDKINIGFDIDGVALKYTERFAQIFPKFGGKTQIIGITEFNFFNYVPESEYKALWMSFAYMMQEELEMYSDFARLMRFLMYDVGQKINFITARQKDLSCDAAYKSIEKFCLGLNIHPNLMSYAFNIDCVGKDGNHGSKVPLIKEYGMEYFVEDRRKNVLEISQAGVTVFMPRRSWNTIPENTPNVIQYNDASEIIKYFKN